MEHRGNLPQPAGGDAAGPFVAEPAPAPDAPAAVLAHTDADAAAAMAPAAALRGARGPEPEPGHPLAQLRAIADGAAPGAAAAAKAAGGAKAAAAAHSASGSEYDLDDVNWDDVKGGEMVQRTRSICESAAGARGGREPRAALLAQPPARPPWQ
jgi:hypothetical protein